MAGKPAMYTVMADEFAKSPDVFLKPVIPYVLSVSRKHLSFVPKSCFACAKSYSVELAQVKRCYKIVNAPQVLGLGLDMAPTEDQPEGYSHKLWVVGFDEATSACHAKIESMIYLLKGEVIIAGLLSPVDKSITMFHPDAAKRLFKIGQEMQIKATGEVKEEYFPVMDKTVKLTRKQYGVEMIVLDSSLATEEAPAPVECSVFCVTVDSFVLKLDICTTKVEGKTVYMLPPKDKQTADISSAPLSIELEPATILAAPYTQGMVAPKGQRPRTASSNGGRTSIFGSGPKAAKEPKPEGEAPSGGIMSKIKRGTSIATKKTDAAAAPAADTPEAATPTEAAKA